MPRKITCLSNGTSCSFYYRPQTKFAKVMFSQVSVCPWGVCAPLHAGIHPPDQRQTPPSQCMLGYGQLVSGTHPTGMHSCNKCVYHLPDQKYKHYNLFLSLPNCLGPHISDPTYIFNLPELPPALTLAIGSQSRFICIPSLVP